MTRVEKAFLRAVEDLNAGRPEPVEHYLELVARSEQQELAELLAVFFANRPPAVGETPSLGSPSYQRALAALDAVTENAGSAGVLPGTLVSLRRLRGMKASDVTDALARRFELGERARKRLDWLYHRLETGRLPGANLSRRLLAALAEILDAEADDFLAASEPVPPRIRRAAGPVMARSAGRPAASVSVPTPGPLGSGGPDPELEAVERLFTGGRHA